MGKIRAFIKSLGNKLRSPKRDLPKMEEGYAAVPHRRDYERYMVNMAAVLTTADELNHDIILSNLSVRGVGLACGFVLAVKSRVKINFSASQLVVNTVDKEAEVVWCNRVSEDLWHAGLDFGVENILELK